MGNIPGGTPENGPQTQSLSTQASRHTVRNRVGAILLGMSIVSSAVVGYQNRSSIQEGLAEVSAGIGLNKRLFAQESHRSFFSQWSELQSGFHVTFVPSGEITIDTKGKNIIMPQSITLRDISRSLGKMRSDLSLSMSSISTNEPYDVEKAFLFMFLELGKERVFREATTFSQADYDRIVADAKGIDNYPFSRSELPQQSIKISEAINFDEWKGRIDEARRIGDTKQLAHAEKEATARIYDVFVRFPWKKGGDVADSCLVKNIDMKHLTCNGKSAYMQIFLEKLGIASVPVEVANPTSVSTHQASLVNMSNGKSWYVDPTYGNIVNLSKMTPVQSGSYSRYVGLNDAVGQKGEEYLCVFDVDNGLLNAQLQNFAEYYYAHGYYHEARQMYEKSAHLTGSNNHFGLAQTHMRQGNYRYALKQYRLASNHFPDSAEFRKYISEAQKR